MKVSLVISTYNWKDALCLCLLSVTRQTVIPTEVIIADDGSRSDTKLLIEEFKNHFPCPIKHVWHEDNGWRKCIIMNKAFAVCEGDYIIEIDGDIIMHSHFIEDHVTEATPGCFLVGSRGKINEKLLKRLLQRQVIYFHSRRVPETECIALAVAYASILFLQTESERERM